jgi:hypothetical protein
MLKLVLARATQELMRIKKSGKAAGYLRMAKSDYVVGDA